MERYIIKFGEYMDLLYKTLETGDLSLIRKLNQEIKDHHKRVFIALHDIIIMELIDDPGSGVGHKMKQSGG
jgi:hypothetical protein